MDFSNVIFPELHDWSLLTGWCAALLIIGGIAFLLVNLVHHRKSWRQVALLLLVLVIGVWSLMVAFGSYQQWFAIMRKAPEHGIIAYEHIVNNTYLTEVQRIQIQFAVTVIPLLLLLLFAGRIAFHSFLKREVRNLEGVSERTNRL